MWDLKGTKHFHRFKTSYDYFSFHVTIAKCMNNISVRLRLLCGAGGYAPNVLQPTEAHFTNPALVFLLRLQRRSTSYDVRGLYQRRVKLWARNSRSNLAYNSTSTEFVGFFYMPQSYDMEPIALFSLRRKVCWGFFRPEKSDGFGRVLNRELGYQKPTY
jgi:hypothetical protein